MNITLKKGLRIGFLAAEQDQFFLKENFVDNGILEILTNTEDPRFILLGRTGSGKTALVEKLKEQPLTSCLNPEELSFQYLCNSNIINYLNEKGSNFDIFYKFLWKHICVLELIRVRYETQEEVDKSLFGIFDIQKIMKRTTHKKEQDTKASAKGYIEKYGDRYWISSDTRIKNITNEIENRIENDAILKADFEGLGGSLGAHSKSGHKNISNIEISQRLNNIVHEYLVSDLNKLVDLMSKNSFSDKHKKYYILIDDLDKNWMPDSKIYVDLIKTLLDTANEINRRISNLKIIVSIREDALYRIFENIKQIEPQREKWNDVIVKLNWDPDNLKSLVEKRLNHIFKHQYTTQTLTFENIFPDIHKKNKEISFKFLIDRTFLRPRDVIDFVNTTIETAVSNSSGKITWSTLNIAEKEYSIRRYDSVLDEWKSIYPGIDKACRAISRLGGKFNYDMISDTLIEEIIMSGEEKENYFVRYLQSHIDGKSTLDDARISIVRIFFIMGIIGVNTGGNVIYSFNMNIFTHPEFGPGSVFSFHKMFRPALGLSN